MSVNMSHTEAAATCGVCQRVAVSEKHAKDQFRRDLLGPGAREKRKYASKLTERQRAFAAHPEVTINPRKAAMDVGYSYYYAKSNAVALREQLAPLIMEYQERAKRRSAISTAKVQQELAAMGFANIADYFDVRDDGSIIPKKLNELTREQTAAIQEMKVVEYENPETGEQEYRVGYIKLADKRANLVELGKTLGMFNPRAEDSSAEMERKEMLRQVPTEKLEAAEKMLLEAVEVSRNQRAMNDAIEGQLEELPQPGAVESEDPNEQ